MKHSAVFLAVTRALLLGSLLSVGACDYDPPPDVVEFACVENNCVLGEPIVLRFSEPVRPDSLVLSVWPGEQDRYDIERERLPSVTPIVADCTLATSPCGEGDGLTLSLDDARTALTLTVARGALGPPNRPLVLEIAGSLSDDSGRTLDVVRRYAFQIVLPAVLPGGDTVGGDADTGGDVAPPDPLGVQEGPFLFWAVLSTPVNIELPQQFFGHIQVDQESGAFYALMTDADPVDGAPRNTSDPAELTMDLGVEGFIFLVQGTIVRQAELLVFTSEPFVLELSIGPITFALRDAVMRGSISTDEATGLARWDGTLAVGEVVIDTGGEPQTYPAQQDNFQMLQLRPEQAPDNQPQVCEDTPCADLQGEQCTVPTEGWPPSAVCPDDDAPPLPEPPEPPSDEPPPAD